MTDLISRSAAIEACRKWRDFGDIVPTPSEALELVIADLEALPVMAVHTGADKDAS